MQIETPDNHLYFYRAWPVRVIDGDTFVANVDMGDDIWQHNKRIRLMNIDTPEPRGPTRTAGLYWTGVLNDMILGPRPLEKSNVLIHSKQRDSFGRWLAFVYQIEPPHECINDLLWARGCKKGIDLIYRPNKKK